MELNYQNVLTEDRQRSNRIVLIWMNLLSGLIFFIWALELLQVFPIFGKVNLYCVPAAAVALLISRLFVLSSKLFKKTIQATLLAWINIVCCLVSASFLSYALPGYGTIVWMLPMLVACQYCSKKMIMISYFFGVIGLILTQFSAKPCILIYIVSLPLFYSISKRSELLLKKQRLLTMAHQAKKSFDELSEFPDTFETDCRIKARYLAKNGINIDKALEAMDNNIEKYNDFVLTFVGEIQRTKEEMLRYLDKDTLIQYGSRAHLLRTKANALGLTNLTDTAFFHEMEAYAGNYEIVVANWEKLSYEWIEAGNIFTEYISSLGLKNHAYDKTGNQISFKEWGEQLQEAFDAIDSYDTVRAKKILSHLLQYQIDKDINQKLTSIIANIDDILKA